MSFRRTTIAALALAGLSAPALALDFTMDFDDIPLAIPAPPLPDQDFGSAVLGFYNDDPVYDRTGKQAWNTTFSADAVAICSFAQAGGACQGNFNQAYSPVSAVGSIFSPSFDFSISPGLLVSKLSFFYNVTVGAKPLLQLFSGGVAVFSQALEECATPGSDGFCGWKEFTVPESALSGNVVTKVAFASTPNSSVFDDISVSTSPIPEPSTYALMLGGLALLAGISRRRAL